jgi:hypothetical protein
MWGPARTRAQVIGLDNRGNFGSLFNEVCFFKTIVVVVVVVVCAFCNDFSCVVGS